MATESVRIEAHTWSTVLEKAVSRYGSESTAFFFEGPSWQAQLSFAAWQQASAIVSTCLTALGVSRGDRVAVAAPGGPIWPVLQVACSNVGAILVPLNIRYRHDEYSHVFAISRPRVIFALEALRENRIVETIDKALNTACRQWSDEIRAASATPTLVTLPSSELDFTTGVSCSASNTATHSQARLPWSDFLALASQETVAQASGGPRDPVLLQFTSGTTAFPKGALLTNDATIGVAFHLAERMGLAHEDIMFGTQPFYHVGGTVGTTLIPLTHGCTVVVPERYRPEEAFRLIPKYGCTARTGQGAMYAMELTHPAFSPETFKSVKKGWAAGTPELLESIRNNMGITNIVTLYGLTEACSVTTATSWRDDVETRTRSCGYPLPGLEVGILSNSTVHHRPHEVGEICVRGWSVMDEYYADEEATAQTIDADGWLHTGDLGYLDSAENLYFVDRLKDMIKPGGENVSAAEVERVIASFADVKRVAVVGSPDARLGEVPVAFVERQPDSDIDAVSLTDLCAKEMAGFKVPRHIFFVEEWPMTESGKVQKHLLREQIPKQPGSDVGRSG